jgi:ribosomal protein L5
MNVIFLRSTNYLINLSLINSFFYKNSHQIKNFNKVILGFNIRDSLLDTTAVYFPKTLWLLEHIGLQKGYVVNLKTKRVGRNQRRVIFSSQVVLRNSRFLDFIYFFLCFIIYGIYRKFLTYNLKIDRLTGDYSFVIKDVNVYPGFLEDFFKWFYPLLINLILTQFNLSINQHIFQELGLYVC